SHENRPLLAGWRPAVIVRVVDDAERRGGAVDDVLTAERRFFGRKLIQIDGHLQAVVDGQAHGLENPIDRRWSIGADSLAGFIRERGPEAGLLPMGPDFGDAGVT